MLLICPVYLLLSSSSPSSSSPISHYSYFSSTISITPLHVSDKQTVILSSTVVHLVCSIESRGLRLELAKSYNQAGKIYTHGQCFTSSSNVLFFLPPTSYSLSISYLANLCVFTTQKTERERNDMLDRHLLRAISATDMTTTTTTTKLAAAAAASIIRLDEK